MLISIQSLILCAEPYYNEPGFERNYGTSVGKLLVEFTNCCTKLFFSGNAESNRYNEEVFKNNLKFAILSQLGSPPEGFEEVTRAHFYLKRHSLIKVKNCLIVKNLHRFVFPRSWRPSRSCTRARR